MEEEHPGMQCGTSYEKLANEYSHEIDPNEKTAVFVNHSQSGTVELTGEIDSKWDNASAHINIMTGASPERLIFFLGGELDGMPLDETDGWDMEQDDYSFCGNKKNELLFDALLPLSCFNDEDKGIELPDLFMKCEADPDIEPIWTPDDDAHRPIEPYFTGFDCGVYEMTGSSRDDDEFIGAFTWIRFS